MFQQFSRDFPGVFLENPRTDPGNRHSLLEFSELCFSNRVLVRKEKDDDHDQDYLKKAFWHIWHGPLKDCFWQGKDDDHDQDFLKKDLLHIWSWSSDKSSSLVKTIFEAQKCL